MKKRKVLSKKIIEGAEKSIDRLYRKLEELTGEDFRETEEYKIKMALATLELKRLNKETEKYIKEAEKMEKDLRQKKMSSKYNRKEIMCNAWRWFKEGKYATIGQAIKQSWLLSKLELPRDTTQLEEQKGILVSNIRRYLGYDVYRIYTIMEKLLRENGTVTNIKETLIKTIKEMEYTEEDKKHNFTKKYLQRIKGKISYCFSMYKHIGLINVVGKHKKLYKINGVLERDYKVENTALGYVEGKKGKDLLNIVLNTPRMLKAN